MSMSIGMDRSSGEQTVIGILERTGQPKVGQLDLEPTRD